MSIYKRLIPSLPQLSQIEGWLSPFDIKISGIEYQLLVHRSVVIGSGGIAGIVPAILRTKDTPQQEELVVVKIPRRGFLEGRDTELVRKVFHGSHLHSEMLINQCESNSHICKSYGIVDLPLCVNVNAAATDISQYEKVPCQLLELVKGYNLFEIDQNHNILYKEPRLRKLIALQVIDIFISTIELGLPHGDLTPKQLMIVFDEGLPNNPTTEQLAQATRLVVVDPSAVDMENPQYLNMNIGYCSFQMYRNLKMRKPADVQHAMLSDFHALVVILAQVLLDCYIQPDWNAINRQISNTPNLELYQHAEMVRESILHKLDVKIRTTPVIAYKDKHRLFKILRVYKQVNYGYGHLFKPKISTSRLKNELLTITKWLKEDITALYYIP